MRRRRRLHAVATLALATTLLATSTQTGLGADPTPTPTPTPRQSSGPGVLVPLTPTQGFPIVLPHDGTVLLQVLSSSTAATAAEVGLHLPTRMVLVPNAIASIGQVATVGTFTTNTQLTFYFLLNQIGQEYLSTSDHAKIVADGPDAWNIGWEDSNDFDYNDVVVRVCYQAPGVQSCPRFPGATFGIGGYGHGPSTTALQAEPVNTATGNYTTSAVDFRLPGRGVGVSFTRTYNSLSTDVGTLGIGWTHSYAAHLVLNGDGSAAFVAEDGSQLRFGSDGSGGFLRPPGTYDRLTAASPGFELLRHDQVTYAFDASGTLTSLTDRNGNEVTLGYTAGRLSSITDTVGRVVSLGYDAQNRLATVSFPPARSVTYGYDPVGRLASVIDARGGTTTYAYDSADRLESITDQNQHRVVLNTYGPDGRVIEQVDARGFHTTFAWDSTTEKSTMTDAREGEWVDDYAGGVLVAQTNPLGNVTKYGFTAELFGSFYVDPRGYKVETVSDDAGNVLNRTYYHPLFATESATYNSMNNVLTSTDRRGKTTTFTYDVAGNLKTATGPAPTSPLTTYNYDPTGTGLLFSVVDPRLKTTTYGYDGDANRNRITTPMGDVTTRTYDTAGRVESVVEPRGNASGANPADYTTTFTYNPADHLRTTPSPLGHVTSIDYDPAGNRSALTDANTHVTAFEYDEANHLTAVVDADSKRTEYDYDMVGNLTSRTDANLHVTTYEYDLAKRMTSQTEPLSRVWTYSYDANGNVTKVIDPIASATPTTSDYQVAYTYDEWNRQSRATFFGNGQADYTYDENSNRKTLTDGAGSSTYTYDELNRLKIYRRGSRGLDYQYDAGGNITRRTYTDGTVVDLAYDNDGRLATMSTAGLTTTYGYDPSSNLLTTTLPAANGYVETRTYDRSGRLTEVKNQKGASVLSRSTYILDPVGNRMSNQSTAGTITYTYDALDRLTQACYTPACSAPGDNFRRYTYDPVGNIATEVRDTGTTTYTHDAYDQLTGSTGPGGSVTYSYDADGRQIAAGSRSFTWVQPGRLATTTLGNTTTTYTYDGDGLRLQASTGSQANKKTNYDWDPNAGLPQLIAERDGNSSLLRRYRAGLDTVMMDTGSNPFYFHYDGLGSMVNLTSSTGVTQWTYAYLPYGGVRTETKNQSQAPANVLRFTGELLDPTGLYHLRARQYDPAQARFLSTEPQPPAISDPYVSTYAYVNRNPIGFTDPSGRCPWAVIGGAIGFIAYTGSVAVTNYVQGKGASLEGWDPTDAVISTVAGALSGGISATGISVGGQIAMNAILGFDSSLISMAAGGRRDPLELLTGTFFGAWGPLLPGGEGAPGVIRGIFSSIATNTGQNIINASSSSPGWNLK